MIDEERSKTRAALAPRAMCDLPRGKKLLPRRWWEADFAHGSALRHREECRARRERAAKRRKRKATWDECRQADIRGLARYEFTFGCEMWTPSTARH